MQFAHLPLLNRRVPGEREKQLKTDEKENLHLIF